MNNNITTVEADCARFGVNKADYERRWRREADIKSYGALLAPAEEEHIGESSLTILEMIEVWRQGCSCADPGHPEQCEDCTVGLIKAIVGISVHRAH